MLGLIISILILYETLYILVPLYFLVYLLQLLLDYTCFHFHISTIRFERHFVFVSTKRMSLRDLEYSDFNLFAYVTIILSFLLFSISIVRLRLEWRVNVYELPLLFPPCICIVWKQKWYLCLFLGEYKLEIMEEQMTTIQKAPGFYKLFRSAREMSRSDFCDYPV